MSLLGIDIGTTGCKAAAFSIDGTCIAQSYREYPAIYPQPGWIELDSHVVWRAVRNVIRETAGLTGDDPITALSVSSLGESVVPVTLKREILGNSILVSDTRGKENASGLTDRFSAEELYHINPNIIGPGYTFEKLMWMKTHQPAQYEQADLFLLWGPFTLFMLGGEPCATYSLASRTMLFDIDACDWSAALIAATGLDREKLPPCIRDGTIVGTVNAAAAHELGLPAGVKLVAGGHDQCCNALGAGALSAGKAVDGLGSFECITPVYDTMPDRNEMLKTRLCIEHHVLPGLYVSFIYNQGGTIIRWFRDTFAGELRDIKDVYTRLAAEMPGKPTNLFVLPYFEPTGPPGYISDASGVIVGLKTATTRGEIYKAFMESITYYFADSIDVLNDLGVTTREMIATGGGAGSDAWLQIKADILNIPYVRLCHTECSLLGAAVLAGCATGVFDSAGQAIERWVRRDRVFEPDALRHEQYIWRIQKYRELYPLMKEYLSSLEDMG